MTGEELAEELLREASEEVIAVLTRARELTPAPARETMDTPGGRTFAQALAQAARKEPTPLTQSVGTTIDPATREKLERIR